MLSRQDVSQRRGRQRQRRGPAPIIHTDFTLVAQCPLAGHRIGEPAQTLRFKRAHRRGSVVDDYWWHIVPRGVQSQMYRLAWLGLTDAKKPAVSAKAVNPTVRNLRMRLKFFISISCLVGPEHHAPVQH